MTGSESTYRTQGAGDGRGVITRDSKIGQVVNAGVTAAGLALVEVLRGLSFDSFPSVVATLAPPAVGLIVGWLTNKALPRFKR